MRTQKAFSGLLARLIAMALLASVSVGADRASAQLSPQFFTDLVANGVVACRILDTRFTNSGNNPLAAGETRGFSVFGSNLSSQGGSNTGCGIPSLTTDGVPQAISMVVNVVAVNPQGIGNLQAWPGDIAPPTNPNIINYQALNPNLNIANEVGLGVRTTAPLGSGQDIKIKANGASTGVIADVIAYYSPSFRQTQVSATSPNLIGGFGTNSAGTNSFPVVGATISGGGDAGGPNSVTSNFGTVGGGRNNNAGGNNNNTVGFWSTVGGGEGNGAAASHATVGGGTGNLASGDAATIGGGSSNQAVGSFATVPGGTGNVAGAANSFAAGAVAKITDTSHTGAIVFAAADNLSSNFSSAAAKEFAVRAAGGIRLRTADDASTGCSLAAGSGTFSCTSDRSAKTDFEAVDVDQLLAQVGKMPLSSWRFKGQTNGVRHIGPVAQDFHAAFHVGESDKTIDSVDADGVALAAIQALYKQLQQKDAEIQELRARLNGMQSVVDRVERLERQLPVRTVALDEPRH